MTERTEVLAGLALRVARADWYVQQSAGIFGRAEADCTMRGASANTHLKAADDLQEYCNAAIEISNLLLNGAKDG